MALAFRQKSFKPFIVFHLRSEAVNEYISAGGSRGSTRGGIHDRDRRLRPDRSGAAESEPAHHLRPGGGLRSRQGTLYTRNTISGTRIPETETRNPEPGTWKSVMCVLLRQPCWGCVHGGCLGSNDGLSLWGAVGYEARCARNPKAETRIPKPEHRHHHPQAQVALSVRKIGLIKLNVGEVGEVGSLYY